GEGRGVRESLRRSSLERHWERVFGRAETRKARQTRQRIGEKRGDEPCGVSREHANRVAALLPVVPDELTEPPIVGERAIGPQEAIERRRQRADRHREAERVGRRLEVMHPKIAQEVEYRIEADL